MDTVFAPPARRSGLQIAKTFVRSNRRPSWPLWADALERPGAAGRRRIAPPVTLYQGSGPTESYTPRGYTKECGVVPATVVARLTLSLCDPYNPPADASKRSWAPDAFACL